MKKIAAFVLALAFHALIFGQDSTVTPLPAPTDTVITPITVTDTTAKPLDTVPRTAPVAIQNAVEAGRSSRKNKWASMSLANRSKDHLLIQIGYNGWGGAPDSINTKGLPRVFNLYFMYDFPFKSNPQFSVGLGLGISSNNMFFSKTYIDITGQHANRLGFEDRSDTTHFKKYKLVTTYLEAPVELRYTADPSRPNKSWKAALGVKLGTLLSAGTKGKNLQNSAGNTINAFVQKEKAKRYFNSTRISATGRVGIGVISLFASYQVNAFIKEGFGPDVHPYAIGLTISGL